MKKILFLLALTSTIVFAVTENTGRFDNITTNDPAKTTIDLKKNVDIQSTGGLYLPSGSTAQRPAPTKDGMLRYNASSTSAEIYAAGNWGSIGGGLSAWVTAKNYAIGDIAIESNRIYKCLIAHTSGTFSTDLAANNWIEISNDASTATGTLAVIHGGTGSTAFSSQAIPFYDGTKLTDDPGHLTFTPATDVLYVNGIQLGGNDAFGRDQMWNHKANAILRLGQLSSDGDPSTSSSEGVVSYGQNLQGSVMDSTNFGYARIKPMRFGLYNSLAGSAEYIFKVDPTSLYLTDNSYVKTFEVTRATGAVNTSGQITSTVASGTSPLIIASTTKVNNLHVDRATLADTVTTNANLTGSVTSVGNATTVITNANLTGDVTSVGNATTYSNVVPTTKGGTGLSTVGTETKVLKVVSGAPAYAEEDRSNLLINPNFEDSALTEWTCTTGTCASTSTSGEFSEGLRAMKVALSAQAMNVSQSVATVSGSTTQYVVSASYKVPSTMADFQICTLIAGSEKTCVPSASLILDNSYHSIEIPEVITPGSTVGIKFKTTSSYTADAFFDKAVIKQGIGLQNLALDNVYSASVSSTGVVSAETKDWISQTTCTHTTGTNTCSFVTGTFTVAPNCWVINTPASISGTAIATTSSVTWETKNNSGTLVDVQTGIACQKSGNDYLAASAAVYSQSSANTDWAACTFSTLAWQGLGTVTNTSLQCRRNNGMLEMKGAFTTGTTTASLMQIPLPNNYGTLVTQSAGTSETYGFLLRSAASTSTVLSSIATAGLGYFQVSGTLADATNNPLTAVAGNAVAAGPYLMAMSNIRIPIAGWSNSSSINGTFAGTPKIPGLDGNVDIFTVNYGTTNGNTDCTASPCSYLDQFGTGGVTSITRSAIGSYVINTPKTYSKLKCTADLWRSSSNTIGTVGNAKINCTSTNACAFATEGVDTHGNLNCQGSY